MPARKPDQIAVEAAKAGQAKARTSWDKTLVGAFLAGAYISFGALVAITVSAGLDPELWGTLPTLFTGIAFTLGLVLVLLAGSSLLTGNMLLVPLSAMDRRISPGEVARNLGLVLLGNVVGALFVAFFLATETGDGGGGDGAPESDDREADAAGRHGCHRVPPGWGRAGRGRPGGRPVPRPSPGPEVLHLGPAQPALVASSGWSLR